MPRRWPGVVILGLWLVSAAGCSPAADLKKLTLIPGISGYFDGGIAPNGENRLLPALVFQLKNESDQPMRNVTLTVAFWTVAGDRELDSVLIRAIRDTPLPPAATGETLTTQSTVGFSSPAARAEFFTHAQFVDIEARVFAQQRGHTVPIGKFPIERRLLPTARRDGTRP